MLMPLGKYKGTPIEKLSDGYIRWAIENLSNIDGETVEALMAEHRRRGGVLSVENETADRRASIAGKTVQHAGIAGLQKAWQEANKLFEKATGAPLPPCRLAFRTNKNILGTWYPFHRLLTISNYWILPRQTLQSVIVHEMCHQYITDRRICESAPHGPEWKKIAAVMSRETGLDIQRTTKPIGFIANDRRRAEPNTLYFYDE